MGNVDVAKYFGFNSVFYSVYISHMDHVKLYSPARHNNVETDQYNAHVHLQTFSPMDKVPVWPPDLIFCLRLLNHAFSLDSLSPSCSLSVSKVAFDGYAFSAKIFCITDKFEWLNWRHSLFGRAGPAWTQFKQVSNRCFIKILSVKQLPLQIFLTPFAQLNKLTYI